MAYFPNGFRDCWSFQAAPPVVQGLTASEWDIIQDAFVDADYQDVHSELYDRIVQLAELARQF